MGEKNRRLSLIAAPGLQYPPYRQSALEPSLERSLLLCRLDQINTELAPGCCDSGRFLRIYGVSRGCRIVQESRGFPEMVGHSGCYFGFCARGDGFRSDGGGSRQGKPSQHSVIADQAARAVLGKPTVINE